MKEYRPTEYGFVKDNIPYKDEERKKVQLARIMPDSKELAKRRIDALLQDYLKEAEQ